jgi:hypothetical protein
MFLSGTVFVTPVWIDLVFLFHPSSFPPLRYIGYIKYNLGLPTHRKQDLLVVLSTMPHRRATANNVT